MNKNIKKAMDSLRLNYSIRHDPSPKMFLLVGLPRSGKSTWTAKHIDYFDAISIENDWIRENILHAQHSKSNDPAIWMITDATARIILSQGRNIIVDGVNLTQFTRKFFIDMARECGAKVVIVWIDTDLETCLNRNRDNPKLPDDVLKCMYQKMEIPQPHEYNYLIIRGGQNE